MRAPGLSVSVSYFYDDLAPYGSWIDNATYGRCWAPAGVSSDWRPYSDGYWVSTVDGWCWISDDPWGWATEHYGRWAYDPMDGWLWIPGTVWAPAWVAWHYSDDWIGWAPLPPSAGWDPARGLRQVNVDRIPAQEWCFVPHQHFLDRRVRSAAVSPYRNVQLLSDTRDATRFQVRAGRPVNQGVDVRVVERTTDRPVETRPVVRVNSPNQTGDRIRRGRAVGVYRPDLRPKSPAPRPGARQQPAQIRHTPPARPAPPAPARHEERRVEQRKQDPRQDHRHREREGSSGRRR